jgi:cytochrome c peroxidase
MKKKFTITLIVTVIACFSISFKNSSNTIAYTDTYFTGIEHLQNSIDTLLITVENSELDKDGVEKIKQQIQLTRNQLKVSDFWLRYLEPLAYKKINAPLPVEWETEVFEKFEKPYKREGAGLTLAALYLEEENINKEELANLLRSSVKAIEPFTADSITANLKTHHHFFLCNRLFLLNLAAIYTTGFECPNTDEIIPELRLMLSGVYNIYNSYNSSFPGQQLLPEYLDLYRRSITFVNAQPSEHTKFDHFSFIKDYVNPLFVLNQKMIARYKVSSKSMLDYSLSKTATSIFDKDFYYGQNFKGIFHRVRDEQALATLDKIGKMLFYDPILSGNNKRSCVSCHKPTEYFTDTTRATSFQLDHTNFLPRNAPSLINAQYNHLIMLDGKHISLQDQTKDVITNHIELGCDEKEMLKKVLSCNEYKTAFKELLKYTPTEKEITFEHIASAITFYYGKYGKFYAPFDEAMNQQKTLDASVIKGFNLFMGKAQCATCHFAPQFNGVKPPYIGSEFEVIGVPQDTSFKKLSPDKGRHGVHPADEMLNAFRTGTVRNAEYTKPYMHNGIFTTMEQVVDFYDAGGGVGRGLKVPNQTLASDSLKLTQTEKRDLIAFMKSLNETITFDAPPEKLPASKIKALNNRKIGGEY